MQMSPPSLAIDAIREAAGFCIGALFSLLAIFCMFAFTTSGRRALLILTEHTTFAPLLQDLLAEQPQLSRWQSAVLSELHDVREWSRFVARITSAGGVAAAETEFPDQAPSGVHSPTNSFSPARYCTLCQRHGHPRATCWALFPRQMLCLLGYHAFPEGHAARVYERSCTEQGLVPNVMTMEAYQRLRQSTRQAHSAAIRREGWPDSSPARG
jgi:hypothetical protein